MLFRSYAAIGVLEYWIVDPAREWVMIGTLTQGAYLFQTFMGDKAIVSLMFPSLNLTVEQVLRAGT